MPPSRRVPLREYSARRIALVKPSALGDIIHSLPVLTAVRRRYPSAHITWVVNRAYEPLLLGHPDLDATLPIDRGAARAGWWQALRAYAGLAGQARRSRFDLVIDLQGLFRSGTLTAASGAPRRVGLSCAREGATWFYTDVLHVADFNAVHAVDRYWLVAEALGVGDSPKHFHVPVSEVARAWPAESLQGYPRPWLALGVGSRWLTKRWPPDSFAELARRVQTRFGGTAVFVGTPDERALSQATAVKLAGPTLDLTGRTSLPQLAAVLAAADVMIANDTGPLHLAAALGRPVVAPYTCTRVLLNGPYGGEAGAVESRVACQGSYLRRCPRLDCMAELTADRLWPALEEILHRWQRGCRTA